MGYHALLGPSGAPRWTSCTASPGQSVGKRSQSSAASRPGTALHQAGAECLEDEIDPGVYLGRVMGFPRSSDEGWIDELDHAALADIEFTHRITQPDVNAMRRYVEVVNELVEELNGTLIVETDVPIDHITGETHATGRADVVILAPPLIVSVDAKFGRKKVRAYDVVEEEQVDLMTGDITPEKRRTNLQLAMYQAGALRRFGGNRGIYKQTRAVIVQPFIDWVGTHDSTVEELTELTRWIGSRASLTRTAPEFKPSFENCLFCAGKLDCPARTSNLSSNDAEGFEDVPEPIENSDLF